MLSPFHVSPSETSLFHSPPSSCLYEGAPPPTHSCLPAMPFLYTGALSTSGPRASPTDVQQGHPLLHMLLEPWVPPCVLFGWLFSPRELWEVWLVDIVVLSMGLQTPSVPSFLSLTPPLGSYAQCKGWLLASASVLVRVWQSLSGDSYISLLSVSS